MSGLIIIFFKLLHTILGSLFHLHVIYIKHTLTILFPCEIDKMIFPTVIFYIVLPPFRESSLQKKNIYVQINLRKTELIVSVNLKNVFDILCVCLKTDMIHMKPCL